MIDWDHKTRNAGQALVRLKPTNKLAALSTLDKSALLRVAQLRPEFQHLSLILNGALDDQRIAPFAAHRCRFPQSPKRGRGAQGSISFEHPWGAAQGIRSTSEGRSMRLHGTKLMIHCMFGKSMFIISGEGQVSEEAKKARSSQSSALFGLGIIYSCIYLCSSRSKKQMVCKLC
jgi:hypothetical protein